jgi:hypothetical protein
MSREKKTIAISVVLCFLMAFVQSSRAGEVEERLATEAANAWLKLVDRGKYSESWNEGATYFRNALAQQQWVQSLIRFRKPLGNLLSRKAISKQYTKTLPGAPPGNYVIIKYRSSFENQKSVIETVIPMLDTDMQWRVAGYYIK